MFAALRSRFVPLLCASLLATTPATGQVQDDDTQPRHNAVVSLGRCTGTLITPRTILTAAHCIPSELRREVISSPQIRCRELPNQHEIAKQPREAPFEWTSFPTRKAPIARFGADGKARRIAMRTTAYALPRCADVALLQLEHAVPSRVATPLPVLIADDPAAPPPWKDMTLRHAGWGATSVTAAQGAWRQTGPVQGWSENSCNLVALPPVRDNGARILTGDSGSPLLAEIPGGADGSEVVIAVLFGAGIPDAGYCGAPHLPVPSRHGTYTPTWRAALPDTEATDLNAWLRHFAPEAVRTWGALTRPQPAAE